MHQNKLKTRRPVLAILSCCNPKKKNASPIYSKIVSIRVDIIHSTTFSGRNVPFWGHRQTRPTGETCPWVKRIYTASQQYFPSFYLGFLLGTLTRMWYHSSVIKKILGCLLVSTGCLKKLSFTKLSIWRSCCQLGRNTIFVANLQMLKSVKLSF